MFFGLFELKLKKSIDSILKRNKRIRSFLNLNEMDDILILFTYGDWDKVSLITADLERKGKNVILWTIESSKNKIAGQTLPEKVRVISRKESSSLKGYNNLNKDFGNLQYDTLIDLTTEDNIVLMSLLAENKSKFCIGIKEHNYRLYDFVLLKDESMDLTETYKQLTSYLDNVTT